MIEFMISISIITILVSIILISSSTLSHRVSINTQAYEIALILRQSQVFALGVKEFRGGSGIGRNAHPISVMPKKEWFISSFF